MSKNYKIFFSLLLFCVFLFPIKIFALPRDIQVSRDGRSDADLWVYTQGWVSVETGATSSAYKTESECKKLNGTYNKKAPANKFTQHTVTCSIKSAPQGTDYCEPVTIQAANCFSVYGTSTRCYKDGIPRGTTTFSFSNVSVNIKKYNVKTKFSSGLSLLIDGLWAKADNETYYLCSWATTETKLKNQVTKVNESIYNVSGSSSPAYCVHPGKPFKEGIYNLEWEADLKECEDWSSGYCGFAAIIQEGEKNYNGNYTIINTALRMYASRHLSDMNDSYWDHLSGTTYKYANMYKATAEYVLSSGYAGSSTSPANNILYGGSELSQAIELFKKVESKNIEFKGINVEVISPTKAIKVNDVPQEIILSTDFEVGKTNIKNVTATNNVQVLNYELYSCDDKTCMKILVDVSLAGAATNFKINLEYDHPGDVISKIGYYLPSGGSKYQGMFIYDRDSTSSVDIEIQVNNFVCAFDPETYQYYDRFGNPTDYNGYKESCGCVKEDDKYYIEYPNEVSYEEYAKVCEVVTCPIDPIDYNGMPSDCVENDVTNGIIEDPSICNILNRESSNDLENDYLVENYGNRYCSVYCRDVLEFTFMDKKTALAGQSFKHDLTGKYLTQNYFSTVTLSTRQCGSVINNYDSWKEEYEEANNAVLEAWNELKKWEAFYNLKDGEPTRIEIDPGDSADHINCPGGAIIYAEWSYARYDLTDENGRVYESSDHVFSLSTRASSCSSGSHSCACGETCSTDYCYCETCSCSCASSVDTGYVKYKYNKAIEKYNGAIDERDRILFSLFDCNMMNENDSIYQSYLNKRNASYSVDNGSTHYVSNGTTHSSNYKLTNYDKFLKDFPEPQVDITYEEETTYGNDFDLNFNSGNVKISHPAARDESDPVETIRTYSQAEKWEEYCGVGGNTYNTVNVGESCDNDLRDLSKDSNNTLLTYWYCSGDTTGAHCTDLNITFPINTLVNIEVEKEYGFYQDEKFYTQVLTGQVRNTPSNIGYWIPLDEHIYPVGIQRFTGDYDMNVSYSDLNSGNRKVEFKSGELLCAYSVINDLSKFDCDDDVPYHECYPCVGEECDNNLNVGVYFRTIDLTDIFPNSQYSPSNINTLPSSTRRNIGKNWTTPNAVQVIEEIQKLGDKVYTEKPIQYKVTLTPANIKEIQRSNKLKENEGGYLNYSLINCGSSLHCESNFLKNELKEILGNKYEDLYKTNTRTGLYDYDYRR